MTAKVLSPSAENLRLCAQTLRSGELVAMPTETVYGLAGNGLMPSALAKIFEAKERPRFDPLILHIAQDRSPNSTPSADLERANLADLSSLTPLAKSRVKALIEEFWPGPLTLVLPKLPHVPDLATSGLPTVAIRMPRHPIAQALLSECGFPLAAPSANRFGRISPTSALDVAQELGDRIPLILDGGACEIGVESTVLSVQSDGTLTLLRPGGVSRAEIQDSAKCEVLTPQARGASTSETTQPLPAPGMLLSHYAPIKPLHLLPAPLSELSDDALVPWLRSISALREAQSLGALLLSGDAMAAEKRLSRMSGKPFTVISLSANGDYSEIAFGLFRGLRALDASTAEALVAETARAEQGLGFAIADRLRRASGGTLGEFRRAAATK